MDSVINFPGGDDRDHVISDAPLRLRWGDWRVSSPIQVHVGAAAIFEDYRSDCLRDGRDPSGQMPAHFTLEGCLHQVAQALLRHRQDADRQEEVLFLAGLMEALVNTPSAILRTDLIRRVYSEVTALSARLGVRFSGHTGSFLPSLNSDAQDPHFFARRVAPLDNLQDFFGAIREIAHERHQGLARHYVIYYPRKVGL